MEVTCGNLVARLISANLGGMTFELLDDLHKVGVATGRAAGGIVILFLHKDAHSFWAYGSPKKLERVQKAMLILCYEECAFSTCFCAQARHGYSLFPSLPP